MRPEGDHRLAELPTEITPVLKRRLAEDLRVVVLERARVFRSDQQSLEFHALPLCGWHSASWWIDPSRASRSRCPGTKRSRFSSGASRRSSSATGPRSRLVSL